MTKEVQFLNRNIAGNTPNAGISHWDIRFYGEGFNIGVYVPEQDCFADLSFNKQEAIQLANWILEVHEEKQDA